MIAQSDFVESQIEMGIKDHFGLDVKKVVFGHVFKKFTGNRKKREDDSLKEWFNHLIYVMEQYKHISRLLERLRKQWKNL